MLLTASLVALATLAVAPPARAGEIALFIAEPRPTELLTKAWGGSLSGSFFRLFTFEGEFAKYPGIYEGQGMTTFSAGGFLTPKVGAFTPYGGIGIGVFRQTWASDSDNGTLTLFALGLKYHLGIVVFRGEYRAFGLSGDPLFSVDKRFSLGVGIDF